MIYKSEVLCAGVQRATYKGELGTVRRKGLAKVRQIVGKAVMRRHTFLSQGRSALPWGDTMKIESLSDQGAMWPTTVSSTVRVA